MAHLPKHPGADYRTVFYPRARQAYARPSRSIQWCATAAPWADRPRASRTARYSCRKPDLPPAGGEVVIFDDAYEHEAWNDTSNTRGVVLFVDFRKPRVFQPI